MVIAPTLGTVVGGMGAAAGMAFPPLLAAAMLAGGTYAGLELLDNYTDLDVLGGKGKKAEDLLAQSQFTGNLAAGMGLSGANEEIMGSRLDNFEQMFNGSGRYEAPEITPSMLEDLQKMAVSQTASDRLRQTIMSMGMA